MKEIISTEIPPTQQKPSNSSNSKDNISKKLIY